MELILRKNTYSIFFRIYIDDIPVFCTSDLWVADLATNINGALHQNSFPKIGLLNLQTYSSRRPSITKPNGNVLKGQRLGRNAPHKPERSKEQFTTTPAKPQ